MSISQVAKDAGVSKTSVSRYLGSERHLLSDEMREQIERSITKLGYQPNQMARSLKFGRSRLVGMIVADILNPYSVAVMHGVEAACRQHGYTLMVCNSGNDLAFEQRYLEVLESYSVEGVILQTVAPDADHLPQIMNYRAPIILVDRKLPEFDADIVGLDNYQSTLMATRHLIDQDYRDLVFVTEPLQGVSPRIERESAFHSVLRQHQLTECRGSTLTVDVPNIEALEQGIKGFLTNRGPGPKAMLAANGVVTLQIILALRKLGCRLFDDLGLLGFDELEWSALIENGITTIAQPTFDIGATAMDCLLRRLAGNPSAPQHIAFRGRLHIRGSTAHAH